MNEKTEPISQNLDLFDLRHTYDGNTIVGVVNIISRLANQITSTKQFNEV